MNQKRFTKLVADREEYCRSILDRKGAIYSTNDNRLINFKEAGAMNGESPQEALWGMVSKHVIAVKSMARSGELPTKKWIDDYLGDIHNYMHLLEAIWEEARQCQEG